MYHFWKTFLKTSKERNQCIFFKSFKLLSRKAQRYPPDTVSHTDFHNSERLHDLRTRRDIFLGANQNFRGIQEYSHNAKMLTGTNDFLIDEYLMRTQEITETAHHLITGRVSVGGDIKDHRGPAPNTDAHVCTQPHTHALSHTRLCVHSCTRVHVSPHM